MRLTLPIVNNDGLGDNLIAVSKAYLIADTCGMKFIPPFWPKTGHVLNSKNGYGCYFPVNRTLSHIVGLMVYKYKIFRKMLPVYSFTGQDYWKTGVEDVGIACSQTLTSKGLDVQNKHLLITTEGTWGKYFAIKRARSMLRSLLLSHKPSKQAYERMMEETRGYFKVAVHIRLGDFRIREDQDNIIPGERFKRLPMAWFINLCEAIQKHINCVFFLITDGEPQEVDEFAMQFSPKNDFRMYRKDILDLLLLSNANLVICSNSQFSRLGVFLNDSPYIWPADTLYRDESGRFGYLYQTKRDPIRISDKTFNDSVVRRCFAIRTDFGLLPTGLTKYLSSTGSAHVEMNDDLLYKMPVVIL